MSIEHVFMALFFGTLIWVIIVRPTPDNPDLFDARYKNYKRRKQDEDYL